MGDGSPSMSEASGVLSGSPSGSLSSSPGSPRHAGYFAYHKRSTGSHYLQQVLRNSFDLSCTLPLRSTTDSTRSRSLSEGEKSTKKTPLRQHDGPRRGDDEAERIAKVVARRGRAYSLAAEWDRGSCSSLNKSGTSPAKAGEAGASEPSSGIKPVPSVQEALSAFDPDEDERRKDIAVALAWIRHELHELRREDTQLLSTLHTIRRGINFIRLQQEKRRSGYARSSTIRRRSRQFRNLADQEDPPDESRELENSPETRRESSSSIGGIPKDSFARPRAGSIESISWRLEESSSLPNTPVCERGNKLDKTKSGSAPLLDLDDDQNVADGTRTVPRQRSSSRSGRSNMQLRPLSLNLSDKPDISVSVTAAPMLPSDLSDKLQSASRPTESPRITHLTLDEVAVRTPMRGARSSVKVRRRKSSAGSSRPSSLEEIALAGTRISKAASVLGMTADDVIVHNRRISMADRSSLCSSHDSEGDSQVMLTVDESHNSQANGFLQSVEVESLAPSHRPRAHNLHLTVDNAAEDVSARDRSHHRRESWRVATQEPSTVRKRQKSAILKSMRRISLSVEKQDTRRHSASAVDGKEIVPVKSAPLWAQGSPLELSTKQEGQRARSPSVDSSINLSTRRRSKTHMGLLGSAYKALKTKVLPKERRRSSTEGTGVEKVEVAVSEESQAEVFRDESLDSREDFMAAPLSRDRTAFSAVDMRDADHNECFSMTSLPTRGIGNMSLQNIREEFSLDLNNMVLKMGQKTIDGRPRSHGPEYLC